MTFWIEACSVRGVTPEELRQRTMEFARAVYEFTRPLLGRLETRDAALQLRKAASSVSANYRAVTRARSHRDFTAKLTVVLEEADESLHWLEFLRKTALVSADEVAPLIAEARELVAIFTKSVRTARRNDRDGRH